MRIIFIGGGNMAEAIFARLNDYQVIVIQRNPEKLQRLRHQYPHIQFFQAINFATTENDLVFLAVKPQDASEACQKIHHLTRLSTIVSIMAGISCTTLVGWLKNQHICRVMPNTPSMIGMGANGLYFDSSINQTTRQLISDIFTRMGQVYQLQDEDQIDKMTAIAASSPAYVFYFIESLIDAAVNQFNFDKQTAKDITLQVLKGSIALIENNSTSEIEQLRQHVTSKKGSTEEAINVFIKHDLKQIIHEAEIACYNRAKEISQIYK